LMALALTGNAVVAEVEIGAADMSKGTNAE
jgi:hypothetical protein